MSHHEYEQSRLILKGECEIDPPFYAIIMAAMRKADDRNLRELQKSFPGTYKELTERYVAPGGYLSKEEAMSSQEYDEDELLMVEFPYKGWPRDEYP
jgi:hypothetical protein